MGRWERQRKIDELKAKAEDLREKSYQLQRQAGDVDRQIADLQALNGYPEEKAMYDAMYESDKLHWQMIDAGYVENGLGLHYLRQAAQGIKKSLYSKLPAVRSLPKEAQSLAVKYLEAHDDYEKKRLEFENAPKPGDSAPAFLSLVNSLDPTKKQAIQAGQPSRSNSLLPVADGRDYGLWTIKKTDSQEVMEIKKLVQAREQARRWKGNWVKESKALEEATRPWRRCNVRIETGDLDKQPGYFTRYSIGEEDVCITFVKKCARKATTRFIEYKDRPRRLWKKIDAGEPMEFNGVLPDYFLKRVSNWNDRKVKICHLNIAVLNPLVFNDCLEDLEDQAGFRS